MHINKIYIRYNPGPRSDIEVIKKIFFLTSDSPTKFENTFEREPTVQYLEI